MFATRKVAFTRSCSIAKDHERPDLDEILNAAKAKNKPDRKAKGTGRKTTGNKTTGGGSRDPAIILGVVAQDNMFQDRSVEFPVTNFMDRLEEALNKDQVKHTAEDIKKIIEGKKEEFCKADYMSLQDAKTPLITLLTEVMMGEAGFIIE